MKRKIILTLFYTYFIMTLFSCQSLLKVLKTDYSVPVTEDFETVKEKADRIIAEKDYIKKLDQDNNKLENFNKITMPRYEKKTYRTFRGLLSALMHKTDVWIENRKKEHTT